MDIWTPVEDETLRLMPEPTNSVDGSAAAVMKEGQVVAMFPSTYFNVLEKGCKQS